MIRECSWNGCEYKYPNNRPATPKEFKETMEYIKNNSGGCDNVHVDMDGLMCHLLRDLGYGDGVDIFIGTDKWYA